MPLDARLERRVVRWQVHRSLLEDMFDTSVDHSLHLSKLLIDIQFFKWIKYVRTAKVVFYEVLQRVEEQMPPARVTTGKGCFAPHDCFLRFLFSRIVLHFFTLVLSLECLTIPCPNNTL